MFWLCSGHVFWPWPKLHVRNLNHPAMRSDDERLGSMMFVDGLEVNIKVTRTGTEPLFKVRSFFYSTMVMNYDTYLEIDQDSDSRVPLLTLMNPQETAS